MEEKGQNQMLVEKWNPVLNDENMPKIGDAYRRTVTAKLLENQINDLRSEGILLNETAPANQSGAFPDATNLKGFAPVMIALVRRMAPQLIAYDVCGVQPMQGPVGLIFSMRAKYASQGGTEALFNEANTAYSSANLSSSGHTGTTPAGANSTNYTAATGMTTLEGEGLGSASNTAIPEMSFSIDKVTATAVTRALKAEYSHELQQDLKAIHGLDTEAELANILSTEILTEINREVIRSIYFTAVNGAAQTTTAGTFDLDVDAGGRWAAEKFAGMFFQIERDANAIAKATRRGKGNIVITSSDVASALMAAKMLQFGEQDKSLQVDDTGATFAGTLNGRYKVYIDPYAPNAAADEFFIVGYKGTHAYDAGLFYCPYVPLQLFRAVDPGTFAPKIGFKTRYALVANPFAASSGAGTGAISFASNQYYRKVKVSNLF